MGGDQQWNTARPAQPSTRLTVPSRGWPQRASPAYYRPSCHDGDGSLRMSPTRNSLQSRLLFPFNWSPDKSKMACDFPGAAGNNCQWSRFSILDKMNIFKTQGLIAVESTDLMAAVKYFGKVSRNETKRLMVHCLMSSIVSVSASMLPSL